MILTSQIRARWRVKVQIDFYKPLSKSSSYFPGRALLDRLSGTTVGEVIPASEVEGLLPAPLDVAPYARVTANATCGEDGTEEYCRDTPGKYV